MSRKKRNAKILSQVKNIAQLQQVVHEVWDQLTLEHILIGAIASDDKEIIADTKESKKGIKAKRDAKLKEKMEKKESSVIDDSPS